MNSMPETTDNRLPGTVAELRSAAVTALQSWSSVDSPEQAAHLLESWKRRPEMTDADVTAVLDAMFPESERRTSPEVVRGIAVRLAQLRYDIDLTMSVDELHARIDELLAEGGPSRPAGCPDWCTVEHGEEFDLVLHMGDDHTDGVARRLLDATRLDIQIARCDSTSEGAVGVPNLYVRCEVELTTWEQAAELARAILDGFGYLAGAEKG